jgi:N-acetylglucosaminyldiphosphoundecaprenol N-acetyl-beta-D-mannosaminyltransferase
MRMNDVEVPLSDPIFTYRFCNLSLDEIVELTAHAPEKGQGLRLVVTANLDHVVLLRKNQGLARAYANAWLRTIDGMPVFLYSKLSRRGTRSRVTGADLFPRLLERLQIGRHRPFFVVPSEAVAQGLRDWASSRGFAPDSYGVAVPKFGFERDPAYGAELVAAIRAVGTTHLFFGVGCPKSEIWMDEHASALGDLYGFAVGAAISFFTGHARRAPPVVSAIGFEWLWRVVQEPTRLGRRYFVNSWPFALAIAEDLRRNRK